MQKGDAMDAAERSERIPDIVIITGMSGSGRTQAMHVFEDMGYFCIDNLPLRLIAQLAELVGINTGVGRHLAVTCDLRSQGLFDELLDAVAALEEREMSCDIVFLEASDEVLIRRYSENRRRHPIAKPGETTADAIQRERLQLQGVRDRADMIIDTSRLRTSALRNKLRMAFSELSDQQLMDVHVFSFGFKHGMPVEADIMIDVRFLPNPFYDPEMRTMTGLDKKVSDFVLDHPKTQEFWKAWTQLLDTVMPGYTHLQRAQPTTFGHYMMAYANMFKRDVTRLEDCLERMDECPLGAGALATSTYPVDRFATAQALGFKKPTDNSMDSVSDRDYAIELLSNLSILMMHLSRFSEEIILWCSWEFKFVELDDAYSTGSSIMPQKKNPDVAEIMRGKVGRVYGDLTAMLTILKGLPLTYNRDLQEDKEPFLDADHTLSTSLELMAGMMKALRFDEVRMARALTAGFLNATELADYLVTKGIPFREAHHITGSAVALAEGKNLSLEALPLDALQGLCDRIGPDVFDVLEYRAAVARRNAPGGTGPLSVARQLEKMKAWLHETK